eukprot:5907067-Amphidinium_carterae.1
MCDEQHSHITRAVYSACAPSPTSRAAMLASRFSARPSSTQPNMTDHPTRHMSHRKAPASGG